MAPQLEAPQQHKQSSRKGKRAWRKNVDVREIEDGLENARQEIIAGGILAEKPSCDLFVLDAEGSQTIQKAYNKTHKPLRADEILSLRSAISPIESHKQSRTTNGIIKPSQKGRRQNGVSVRDYQRLRHVANSSGSILNVIDENDGKASFDPWAPAALPEQDLKFDYIEEQKPVKTPRTMKEAPISLVAGIQNAPAVPNPKPGISYNPVFQDWDQLLNEEGKKEIVAERGRLQQEKKEQQRLARIAAVRREKDIVQIEEESAWEGIESEYEDSEWIGQRRPQRKTLSERNRIKRRKTAERQARWDLQTKKKEQQARRIKAIASEVKEEAKLREKMKLRRGEGPAEAVDDRILRRKKFGKHFVPEVDLEVVLQDELKDSLRLLRPEGNLLKDRFRNIMIRGKVEARKPIQQPKKVRRKLTEKWTYKDFAIS